MNSTDFNEFLKKLPNKFLNELKDNLLQIILKSVSDKIQEDPLDQLFRKYIESFRYFSLKNLNDDLPELLGYALIYGLKKGIEYKDIEILISKLKAEFERRKQESYTI